MPAAAHYTYITTKNRSSVTFEGCRTLCLFVGRRNVLKIRYIKKFSNEHLLDFGAKFYRIKEKFTTEV